MQTRSPTQTNISPNSSFTPARSGLLQRKCNCGNSANLTGKCSKCESDRLTLQRKAKNNNESSEIPPIVHEVLNSLGQPLGSEVQSFMESRFERNHHIQRQAISSINPSKLTLGEPHSPREKEADRVTDIVMNSAVQTPAPPSLLAHDPQEYDFSAVRIHTGIKAAESAQALHAQAYTAGQHIVFDNGQFQPKIQTGQRLLIHELTHVLQQGTNQKVLQRKINVGGQPYEPSVTMKARYGMYGKKFLEQIHNDTKNYSFASTSELETEVRIRSAAADTINQVDRLLSCCSFPGESEDYHLNEAFWEYVGPGPTFVLKQGKKPSEAVKAIFKMDADTRLECNSITVAIEYYSLLQGMGDESFDRLFLGGQGLIISHAPQRKIRSSTEGDITETHPLFKQGLYRQVSIRGVGDLLVGDWVYFKNFDDYLDKCPKGLGQGENAIYLGDGIFRGFGLRRNVTEIGMKQELKTNYDLCISETPSKRWQDVPGLQPFARRPIREKLTEVLAP